MSGPGMEEVRAFLAECTRSVPGANILASTLHDHFARWCGERQIALITLRQFITSMGYAGHEITRLDLGGRGFRGIYIAATAADRSRAQAPHLSSLGLAGLHLEMAAGHVASLAARAASDRTCVGQYVEELENQSIARDAFRAELERVTGLPADLIKRRLTL